MPKFEVGDRVKYNDSSWPKFYGKTGTVTEGGDNADDPYATIDVEWDDDTEIGRGFFVRRFTLLADDDLAAYRVGDRVEKVLLNYAGERMVGTVHRPHDGTYVRIRWDNREYNYTIDSGMLPSNIRKVAPTPERTDSEKLTVNLREIAKTYREKSEALLRVAVAAEEFADAQEKIAEVVK